MSDPDGCNLDRHNIARHARQRLRPYLGRCIGTADDDLGEQCARMAGGPSRAAHAFR